jgi:hypothetical protein
MKRTILSALLIMPVVAQAQVLERDSAGVHIVTQPPAARVRLGPALFEVTGSEGGREPFFRLGSDGVRALSAGFVVVNAGTELRYYTRDGALRQVAGGRGSGPGEFQMVSWTQRLAGDSIAAYDSRLRRLSVWTGEGSNARSSQVQIGSTAPAPGAFAMIPAMPTGALNDGALLFMSSVSLQPPAQGMQRVQGWLLRSPADFARPDTLAQVAVIDLGPRTGNGPMTQPIAFLRRFRRSVTAAGLAITDGADYRIDLFDVTGRRRSSVRVQRAALSVRAEDRAAWRAQQSAGEALFPAAFPAYSELWHDSTGRLWAELFRPPTAATTMWDVFAGNGRLLLTIEAPAAVQLVAADASRVYGIRTDELDVQTLQGFELPAQLVRR